MDQFHLSAEKHLTHTWGGPVRLANAETLDERDHVARFMVLEAPTGAPTSIILKGTRLHNGQAYNPEAADPTAPAHHLAD